MSSGIVINSLLLLWLGGILAGATAILVLISQGIILSSTGENGWKILIPFYGQYLFFKRTSDTGGLYLALSCLLVFLRSFILLLLCLVIFIC